MTELTDTLGSVAQSLQLEERRPPVRRYVNEMGDMGVSKNRGTPKMDGLWKTLIKMDDLGVHLFLETPISYTP